MGPRVFRATVNILVPANICNHSVVTSSHAIFGPGQKPLTLVAATAHFSRTDIPLHVSCSVIGRRLRHSSAVGVGIRFIRDETEDQPFVVGRS